MDDILHKLGSAVINLERNDKSSFENLYKSRAKYGNQDERRKDILQSQKNNRNSNLDTFRGILDLVQAVENTIFKTKHYASYRPSLYVAGFTKVSPTYNKVLMLSEWLIDKPEDFCENWYVVPCPKGLRMLVIANNGKTKCYTRYGQFKFEINTALPGGNSYEGGGFKCKCCVLDCFYSENNKIMYVLDLLAWKNQPMTDCETEFRHYWLKTQFEEIPELEKKSSKNDIPLRLLPMVICSPESFNRFMMTHPPFKNEHTVLDGLLFYHKKAHYVAGETPLVGWTYPFMVPEIFGLDVTVHEKYLSQKPEDYIDKEDYIHKFEEKIAKKKSRRSRNVAMDTSDVTDEEKYKNTEETKENEVSQLPEGNDMEAEEIPQESTLTPNTSQQENSDA